MARGPRCFKAICNLRSKFEILFEKTEHLCTFVSNVLPSRADDGEIKATSKCATQTCENPQQRIKRQGCDVECSYADLSTEIEGLKLEIVIAESRAAGNFQSNKQAIDQLRNELNSMRSENHNCLSHNANSNPNENNAILQNQPSEKPETKIQNNIVNTQDFRSDVLEADSVVTIQSENSYQTVRATKPQSRCSNAEKSVEGVSNPKLLNSSSEHTQTSKTQITDRKPKQSGSKSTHLKSCASKSKLQHQWINRLPLIGSFRNNHSKKETNPLRKSKHHWRTANCDVQDAGRHVTNHSCDRENSFYNHPQKKKPRLKKWNYRPQQKNHRSGRHCTHFRNTQIGTKLLNPTYEMKPFQLKSELQLEDKDSWEDYLHLINNTLDQFGTLV